MSGQVTGLQEVLNNLNEQISGIQGATMAGLMEAGYKIERLSKERAPNDLGNLRGSSYTRRAMDGSLSVEVGFAAEYAVYVHESIEMKLAGQPRPDGHQGNYWSPNGEPKFLERTVNENQANILAIIRHHASVGN